METKYRIIWRGSVLGGQGIDGRFATEEKIREILQGNKNIEKIIECLNSGKVLKTKNWVMRLAEDYR